MKLRVRYKRNAHQAEFDEDLTSTFLHLSTGYGGGKSYALVMKALKLSMLNAPYSGGLMAPTYSELKRDIIPIFDDIFEANNLTRYVKYHGTEHWYQFPWTKGKLYLFSGDVKLRGPNLGYFLINESTLIKAERYKEAIGRVRVKGAPYPQIASVGTPEGVGNYVYEMFVDKPMPGSKIIYGDTRNNIENLNPGYITALENSYDKLTLDAYLRGLWVNMNGNQFYYAYRPEVNEDKSIVRIPGEEVHCFLDFNVQYMTATLWHRLRTPYGVERLLGFDEIMIENNADTYRMITALQQRGYTASNTTIYPDPAGKARKTSGKADHQILREAGYQVSARSAAPRMRERQLNVNNLLDKAQIVFNPNTMPTLRRDLQAVEQDTASLEKVKSNPKLTHASDGLDYGCDILFPFSGKREKSGIIKIR